MTLRTYLLGFGVCLCMSGAAQVAKSGTAIEPKLHPVKMSTDIMRPGERPRHSVIQKAESVTKMQEGEFLRPRKLPTETAGKLKLDSIVITNVDGSNSTKMVFEYNGKGKETSRHNYTWDTSTSTWGTPVEEYGWTWREDGFIISEWVKGYGQGTRYDYEYNEQNLGVNWRNEGRLSLRKDYPGDGFGCRDLHR